MTASHTTAASGDVIEVVELRVPGVSGAPPQELLGCPPELLQQLSGDKLAGVYRCRSCCDTGGSGAADLEGYYWGGLTSGAASRALWLLFLPFVLINLAHWMLPASTTGRRAPALAVTILRLLGLALTLTLMLASAEILLDAIGWQCGSVTRCAAHLGPASFLANVPRGRQLMFAAVPVAVMPLALVFLGRPNPPAAVPPAQHSAVAGHRGGAPDPAVTSDRIPLAEPNFWNPDDSVKRLRSCHVMAWMSGLGALMLAAPLGYLQHTGLRTACLALLDFHLVTLALCVGATASTRLTGRGGKTADRLTAPMWWMQWVGVAALLATLAVVACTKLAHQGDRPPASTSLPGLQLAINILLSSEIILLITLFVFTARCVHGWGHAVTAPVRALRSPLRALRGASTAGGFTPSLEGLAAPFVATIALVVAGGFSAGVGLWAAQLVGTPVRSASAAASAIGSQAKALGPRAAGSSGADTPIILPPGYFAAAIAFSALVLLLVALVAAVRLLYVPRRARATTAQVIEDYPGTHDAQACDRASAVARARVLASLTDAIPPALAGFGIIAIAAFGAVELVDGAGGLDRLPVWSPGLSTVCVTMLSVAAAGVVGLAVAATRDREKRRMVGVLWDVITFWPRANHPLTPPCYGERAVPELVGQVGYLVSGSRRLVLTGHSQGSVIAAATVLQADGAGLPRVGLLTFGCPLRRLYARNFPAYFGLTTLEAVRAREPGRWINLWALTDPIGSWVFADANTELADAPRTVDCRLRDVIGLEREPRGNYPPICGHSGFWTRPEYPAAVRLLAEALRARPH